MSLNKNDAVILICRATALYLLFWALSDLFTLPVRIHQYWHFFAAATTGSRSTFLFWRSEAALFLGSELLRCITFLIAAAWLYRAGPRIRRFFADGLTEEPKTAATYPTRATDVW